MAADPDGRTRPRGRLERFTDRARRVVALAQEEARLLNHNYVGTEHLLLGLLQERAGVAAKVLESLGISLDAVRVRVEGIIGSGQTAPTGHIPFTPRAKKVLELSLREALQLGHHYIGTEHLLLGLLREGEGVAAQILSEFGAEHAQVREQVLRLLAGGSEQAGARTRLVRMGEPAGAPRGRAPARSASPAGHRTRRRRRPDRLRPGWTPPGHPGRSTRRGRRPGARPRRRARA
jgi:ATP-dependent Clp protease ATP-binding subunit ClpA